MRKNIGIIILMAVLISSCVPATKFRALQSDNSNCMEERDRLKAEIEKLTVENKENNAKLARAIRDLEKAGKDTVKWKDEVERLLQQNNMLVKDYSDLQKAQQDLVKGSEEEIQRLLKDLQTSQKELQKQEEGLNRLSADVNARKTEMEKVQAELDKRNARLSELEQILNEQQNTLSTLRNKVSEALLGFENQGLTITQKEGKVYVSLEEKLLFKSGSTSVDAKGVTALKQLAKVLAQNPDIDIMIEGHTDDVQVLAGSSYKDNWDLSVLRATSIVRILLDESGINPKRLTTAGRSQFMPVDPAKNPEARQKNRRTEIILSPKLQELYKLIE